jgi:hypothetical protein
MTIEDLVPLTNGLTVTACGHTLVCDRARITPIRSDAIDMKVLMAGTDFVPTIGNTPFDSMSVRTPSMAPKYRARGSATTWRGSCRALRPLITPELDSSFHRAHTPPLRTSEVGACLRANYVLPGGGSLRRH